METKEKPLVSVVIPTYNRAELLKEALESVYAQEGVGEDFEMEVIVVDDASSDATPEVVTRYPGIRYIRLATNSGVSCARNAGIKAGAGKYIAFLDDDDLFLPHRLKSHVPTLEAHPEVGVVYSQFIVEGDGETRLLPGPDYAPTGWVFHDFLMKAIMFMQFTTIRRDAFEKAGYFDESIQGIEDYDMTLRLAFHVPFQFIPGAVAVYRVSESGLWFTAAAKGDLRETISFILEKALAMLPNTTETRELRRKAYLSWLPETVHGLQKIGRTDRMRDHLLTTLKNNQWIIKEPWETACIVDNAAYVACVLALTSNLPFHTVHVFFEEVKATARGLGRSEQRAMKKILAKMWMAVGNTLMKTSPPKYRRPAGHTAVWAVFNDPAILRNKSVWKALIQGILLANSRWEPIIVFCKRWVR
jgi:glycosyltransferase involved in cell wall biosynthesis